MTVLEIFFLAAAAGSALVFWRLLNPPPRLVVNERGILDRSLRIGWIRWNDIEGAYQPHALDDTLSIRLCPDGRTSRRLRRRRTSGSTDTVDLKLDLAGTDMSAVEILQQIMARSGCPETTRSATAP